MNRGHIRIYYFDLLILKLFEADYTMSAPTAEAGDTLASSRWSPTGSQTSDAFNISTGCTTPPQTNVRLQNEIITRIETIAAYLVKERALVAVQTMLEYICDVYKRRVKPRDTE